MANRTIYTLAPEVIHNLKREMARLRCMVRNQQSQAVTRRGAPPMKPIRFRLTEALTTGSSAEAVVIKIDNSGNKTTQRTITVHDALSMFEGAIDAEGYAWRYGDSGHVEIIQMTCPE